jgi:hypothetical protein
VVRLQRIRHRPLERDQLPKGHQHLGHPGKSRPVDSVELSVHNELTTDLRVSSCTRSCSTGPTSRSTQTAGLRDIPGWLICRLETTCQCRWSSVGAEESLASPRLTPQSCYSFRTPATPTSLTHPNRVCSRKSRWRDTISNTQCRSQGTERRASQAPAPL